MNARFAQIAGTAITVALIVTFGFGAAFLLLLILAVSYVVVALAVPVILRAKMRVHEKPAVQAIALDDATIPAEARVLLEADRESLVALGFEARDMMHQPGGKMPAAYLALYQHPATLARALSRVVLKPGKGAPTIHSSDVEFEIRYDNGTTVELSNVAAAIPGLHDIPGLIEQMPHVRDVSRLHGYFLQLAAQHESDADLSTQARVPLPDDATMTSVYHAQVEASCAVRERAGLLVRTGVPGVWRPTWRMAFLIAAGAISPGVEFVRRQVLARGQRLQRKLDGDPTRTGAERIGARVGWTMLGVGLVLALIGFAMAPTISTVAMTGMIIAWSVGSRGGKTPGWRAILIGGVAATLLLAVPIGLATVLPPVGSPFGTADMLTSLGLFLLPPVMVVCGTAIFVEGFRAAAT